MARLWLDMAGWMEMDWEGCMNSRKDKGSIDCDHFSRNPENGTDFLPMARRPVGTSHKHFKNLTRPGEDDRFWFIVFTETTHRIN